jgi:hypothetical protein
MVSLYVVSFEPYSGKSAICLGLGLHYKEKGLNVRYLKPVSTVTVVEGKKTSRDPAFLREKLGLKESPDEMSPVLISLDNLEEMLGAPKNVWQDKVQKAFQKISSSKSQLILLEGANNLSQGYSLNLSAGHVVKLLNAKSLLVLLYKPDLAIDEILDAREHLGGSLIGVMMNKVPQGLIRKVSGDMKRIMGRYQIPITGILPEDSILSSITVNELAEILGGQVICVNDYSENLVENFAVGAMNVDQALTYFRRIPRKAVITGGDRADIQVAALETDTRCLILTGNLYPPQAVLTQAAIRHVPIIIVSMATMETVRKVDEALGHVSLRHKNQITRLLEMIESQPGLKELSESLGLPV